MFSLPAVSAYHLSFTSVWIWLIVAGFVAAVVLTWFYYRRTNPMLSRGCRIALGTLRGLALAALFFVFAEPLLVIENSDTKAPVVAVLVDNSTSMKLNRHSTAQFAAIDAYLRNIESKQPGGAQIVRYSFGDTLRRDGVLDGSLPVTAIGEVLADLKRLHEEDNLQSIVLLSDGASNLGSSPVSEAKDLGLPVTTIGFGDPNPLSDIRVVEINTNPVGFVGKEFPVQVVVESRGFENLRLPLRLRQGERILAEQEIDLQGQGRRQTFDLKYTPTDEGEFVIEAAAPVQSNEESEKNNSRQAQIKIRASQIKILLAAAYLNWDFKFLNRALSARSDFKVDRFVESQQRIGGTIPFPANVNALNEYDAVILYDFDADWIADRKQLLDAFFERTGKGLWILAGERFSQRPKTRLPAEMFPYRFVEGRITSESRETNLALTERGRIHPLLRLGADGAATQRLLNELPPFTAFARAFDPRREATILASVPSTFPDEPETPIFAAQPYRSGKVALLSAWPLWRLDFLTQGLKTGDSTYVRLVENMVLWLVAREDVERITITPERPIFIAGEAVHLNARVLDESYVPVEDADVEAVVASQQNPNDSLLISFRFVRPGLYSADLQYLPSGNYRVSGRITREGVRIANPGASFVVEPYSLEDLSQIANFDLLKRISEVSGGAFYAADDTAAIPRFAEFPQTVKVSRAEFTLFDNIWLLTLIIVALCAEWYLRKRYQLL